MKIDSDLRQAIRAAEREQPAVNYDARHAAIERAIKEFLAQPAVARKVRNAKKLLQMADRQRMVAAKLLGTLGLNMLADHINDEKAFVRAGGKPIPPTLKKWRWEQVMTELAAAKPAARDAILKKYGIDWS